MGGGTKVKLGAIIARGRSPGARTERFFFLCLFMAGDMLIWAGGWGGGRSAGLGSGAKGGGGGGPGGHGIVVC